MANIRNSISLTDRMTPTLRAIMKSMDSTLRVMKNLDKAANNGKLSSSYKRAEKDIQRANNAIKKMSNYTNLVSSSASRGERAYRSMGNAISNAAERARQLKTNTHHFITSLASGVYLAQRLANSLSGVMTTSDTSRSQVARLGLYNNSAYTNEQLYGQVLSTALGTRTSLTDTADLANKILVSGVYSGNNAALAAISTAGIINKALVAGGGTEEENQRALRQLTQGLSSGLLQGDELRSIREQTPYFAQVLAEGLAQVDEKFEGIGIGDLKELGAQGELTADRVIKAMWAMQDEINADFEAMPRTFGQAMTSLSSIWQYFLWLLSDAEGPLGRINDKIWQFVDYMQSAEGFELLEILANGVDVLSRAITFGMDSIGRVFTFLKENADIAQAALIALGVAAVVFGVSAAVSWAAATWYIWLLVGVVGLVSWAFLNAGYTVEQVVGGIIGVVVGLVAVIWDAIVFILELVIGIVAVVVEVGILVVSAIILVMQAITQIIAWAIEAIITAFWFILTVIKTVFLLGKVVVQTFVNTVVTMFWGLAETVLGIMEIIAKGIDAVFGSNLADKVAGWTGTLEGKFTAFVQDNDPNKTVNEIGDMWNSFGSGVKDLFTSDDLNLYDNMGNTLSTAGSFMSGTWDLATQGSSILGDMFVDPNDWYNAGDKWGQGIMQGIGDMNLGIPDSSILDAFTADGVQVSGGTLDGIKSDVNISDEDVQLLRDMAARDFLLQLQSVTPVANVTFGDVRETADVHKIMDVIEQMVDEQLATAMVS